MSPDVGGSPDASVSPGVGGSPDVGGSPGGGDPGTGGEDGALPGGCTPVGLPARPHGEGHLVLEIVYTGILVLVFLFIAWFSVYVVYKLYEGQR